jgi:hypothetical protein
LLIMPVIRMRLLARNPMLLLYKWLVKSALIITANAHA